MKAGATSMWASCCGLLNEVMGTGAVRGQQSGFAGGTGPFRFAPNSDFSTYPSVPMEGPNIVCKACGLSFSVFRKKVQSEIASANTEEEDDEDDDEDDEDDDDEENLEERTPGLSEKRVRASLSDLSSLEDVEGMSVRQLKEILARNFVNYSGCCEKWELVEKVNRLYKENEENQKSYGERLQLQDEEDDRLCRICMDAVIDCVLLECGHMVTCTKCGKRMISVSTSWRHHLITNCLQLPRPKTPVCSMQPPGAASRERLRKQTPPARSPVAVATPSDHGRYFIQLWSEAPTQILFFLSLRDSEQEAETQTEGEAGPTQGANAGLNPGTPEPHPRLKAGAKLLSHPRIPQDICFSYECGWKRKDSNQGSSKIREN
ncbi:E3 ubiquitin-protein ligase RNF34 isoform 4-T4 [Lycaon pictus]